VIPVALPGDQKHVDRRLRRGEAVPSEGQRGNEHRRGTPQDVETDMSHAIVSCVGHRRPDRLRAVCINSPGHVSLVSCAGTPLRQVSDRDVTYLSFVITAAGACLELQLEGDLELPLPADSQQ